MRLLASPWYRDEVFVGLADGPCSRFSTMTVIFSICQHAASSLGLWQEALEFNARTLDSMRIRQASELDIARRQLIDYGPLVDLGRHEEARNLLETVHQAFLRAKDEAMMGELLSAKAYVQRKSGNLDRAIGLEHDALRFVYHKGDPQPAAISISPTISR